MGQILSEILNDISDGRERRAMKTMFDKLLNDDSTATHKAIVCGASAIPISIAGAFTTGISISADGTTGISITSGFSGVNMISLAGTGSTSGIIVSGQCGIPLNITGVFTTGITLAADGTTGISITNAFSGVTMISLAGTASGDGILISGACADALHISGTNTTSAIHISGDQAIAMLVDVDAALATGISFAVDTSITMGTGISMVCTGTGTITTAISLDYTASATECFAMTVASAKIITRGMSMSGAGTYTKGILLDATTITTPIEISAGSITDGILISGTTPVDGIHISSACSGHMINLSGASTGNGLTISGATSDTGIEISGTCANFAIDISAAQTAVGISVAGTCGTYGLAITGACTTAGIGITGAEAVGILIATSTPTNGIEISANCANAIVISGTNTTAGLSISGDQVLGTLFHATAAATAAHSVTIPTGITLGVGLDINATSTGVVTCGLTMQGTGTFTTGINLAPTAGTTGIVIGSGFTTGISVDCATDPSSTVTGSIHTDGGLGVAKKAYIGTDLVLVAGPLDLSTVAIDINVKPNTVAALEFYDATTKFLVFDSRNTVTAITNALFTAMPSTIVAASGIYKRTVGIIPGTTTLTGSTGVTAMEGLGMYVAQPTVTDEDAVTITDASTVYIANAPVGAGSGPATLSNAYALKIAAGTTLLGGVLSVGGVATFDAQDIHSLGLTVASSKAVIQGMNTFPKLTPTILTSGAGYTMSAAQMLSGLIRDTSASTGIAAALPTVAAVVALIGGYVAGTAFYLDYSNPGNQTVTLTVDASTQWTMTGTMTIATTTHRRFLCVINSATTGTVYSIGDAAA